MVTATTKPKAGKSLWDMDKLEMETAFAKVTKQAQQELHANGSPYIIGDATGSYQVFPDGERIFTPYTRTQDE